MCNLLLLGIGGQELVFIALIILLLFGGKKIPELMKGLGKGVKSFKDGVNGIDEITDQEDKKKEMADYYIDSYMELGSAE